MYTFVYFTSMIGHEMCRNVIFCCVRSEAYILWCYGIGYRMPIYDPARRVALIHTKPLITVWMSQPVILTSQ